MDPHRITHDLIKALAPLQFGAPISHVYNPLIYAPKPHAMYITRYGMNTPRQVLLVGMNPGPWGMAQTGVPFGDVPSVRDWLGIDTAVGKPAALHPKRPVQGFASTRREVSGSRVWGWAKARFAVPEQFFMQFFVINYCPLIFFEEAGTNRTPDKLPRHERVPLFAACDAALRRWISYLQPQFVVGIGAFAEGRIIAALAEAQVARAISPVVGRISHPSPASPVANRGWATQIEKELQAMGVFFDENAAVPRRRSVG